MPRYVIERDLPAIGSAEREALKAAAQKSREVLAELGPDIQWEHSYVAGAKTLQALERIEAARTAYE